MNTAGTQPAEQATAGGHSQQILRPAQASKQTATDDRPCSKQQWPQMMSASRRAVQVDGGSAVVLAARKAGADLPNCPYATYRLCLSLSLPTPLICKKSNLAPTYFFFVLFLFFYFPSINSSHNPLYSLCPANLSCLLAYSQPLRSLPGGE